MMRTIRTISTTLASSESPAALSSAPLGDEPGDFAYSSDGLTCVTAGTYKITAGLNFPANETGARTVGIEINGGATGSVYRQEAKVYQQVDEVPSLALTLNVTTIADLKVGDIVAPVGQQDSGEDLAVTGNIDFELIE
jgi:hypothetical protein